MVQIQVLLLSAQWRQRARLGICLPGVVALFGFLWSSPLAQVVLEGITNRGRVIIAQWPSTPRGTKAQARRHTGLAMITTRRGPVRAAAPGLLCPRNCPARQPCLPP